MYINKPTATFELWAYSHTIYHHPLIIISMVVERPRRPWQYAKMCSIQIGKRQYERYTHENMCASARECDNLKWSSTENEQVVGRIEGGAFIRRNQLALNEDSSPF